MRRFGYFLQEIHVSWHIAAISLGVLIGVAMLPLLPVTFGGDMAWLSIGACIFLMVLIRRLRLLLFFSILAGVSIGIWRGGIERRALTLYTPYYGRVVQMIGVVAEDASLGRPGEQRLQLHHVRIDNQTLHGRVWASVSFGTAIKRGDTVYVRGALNTGFGNLSASMYRASLERIQRPAPAPVPIQVRDTFAEGVRRSVSEPQASLGLGFLTGQRTALPSDLEDQLRVVGLTHIVVASGYNLTVLVGFARSVFAGVSRYLATLFAGLMIGGFVMVAGLSPSMSRAGLVAALSLAAWYWGRTIHPLVLLPFTACLTVLVNPSYVWGDVGWMLSFLAFWGVLVLAPLIRRYFWGDTKIGMFKQIATDTLSAQIVTLPLILALFGTLSVYALPANLLVLPLVPIAMLLTFIGGIAGLLAPFLAGVIGWPAELLLNYMTTVVDHIATLPGAEERVRFTSVALIASYGILTVVSLGLGWKTRFRFRE